MILVCFFFNDTATTEIYTLSLHDALPIFQLLGRDGEALQRPQHVREPQPDELHVVVLRLLQYALLRSEEHTSELQSRQYLVCRLLLEKKNNYISSIFSIAHNTQLLFLKYL